MNKTEEKVWERYQAAWRRHGEALPMPEAIDARQCRGRYQEGQQRVQRRLTAASLLTATMLVVLPFVDFNRSTVISDEVSRGTALSMANHIIEEM